MRNKLITLIILAPITCWALGFSLTEENDLFLHKDNNYTQGAEISLDDYDRDTNGVIVARYFYGARSRMYTPKEIENPTNQPNDRPWACVTSIFYDKWVKEDNETVRYGIELGVLGPWAFGECQQTTIHRWVGATTPVGWSNQIPNELSLDLYMLRYYPSLRYMPFYGFSINSDTIYGATIGTTYDNIQIGQSLKIGWNIPPTHLDEGVAPKAFIEQPFIYLLADINGKYVLHNATLGHSFFRKNDKWDRDLIREVAEWHYGICTGYKNLAVTYLLAHRSHEFEGQPENMEWGMARIEWTIMF